MPLLAIIVSAVSRVLLPFAGWIAKFFGSWLMMLIFGLIAEGLPRLLGLGQGLISWGFGIAASAVFSAFQMAMSAAGVTVPSFNQLLQDLPPGVLWAGSAMRIHKVVYILTSILIVKLFRKVFESLAAGAAKGSAASLMSGGK